MGKNFLLTIFLILVTFLNPSFIGADEGCESCPPKMDTPGRDHADDNHAVSDFISSYTGGTGKGTISILKTGYWKAAEQLFVNFSDNINLVEITGNSWPDFVVLPSGALFGKRNDSTFKYALEQYVSQGGTILCFVQQDKNDYILPVPEGSQLQAEGWRNIQSCLYGSLYFDTENMHPALSGQTSQRISAGVDGGFDLLPAGTKVLIKRTVNNQPALI